MKRKQKETEMRCLLVDKTNIKETAYCLFVYFQGYDLQKKQQKNQKIKEMKLYIQQTNNKNNNNCNEENK